MKRIARDDFERMLSRFYGFSDGLIRSVRIRYENEGTRNVEIEVACRDADSTENEGWVSVRILVRKVQEFTMREQANMTLQVLSEGLHIQATDAGVGLEFGGALESPLTTSDLRRSDGFIIGEEIEMEVGSYY